MKKEFVFSDMPSRKVRWSRPMDLLTWAPDVGVVKTTTCLNRFELLIDGSKLEAEDMRKWAHDRLDDWLNSR